MSKFDGFIREILKEMKYSLPPNAVKHIENKYAGLLDIFMVFYPDKNMLEIVTLRATKTTPKGTGSSFMTDITKWADNNGVLLVLQTANKGDFKDEKYKNTTSTNRLKKFYGRFGFKSNYGKRTYNPQYPGNMHREPKKG